MLPDGWLSILSGLVINASSFCRLYVIHNMLVHLNAFATKVSKIYIIVNDDNMHAQTHPKCTQNLCN